MTAPSDATDGTASEPAPDADSTTDESPVVRARERVAELATPDGDYVVACKDTGRRPDPVSAATFPTYETAARAADAARRYRAAMRDVDPDLPEHDLLVCEATDDSIDVAAVRESTGERRANGLPSARQSVTLTGDRRDEWLHVENAPIVHLHGPESLLDDELVTRQLRSKL